MNIDKILSIPAEEYHAESRNGRYMSSHLLADFRESPELYNQPPLRVGGRSPVRDQALPREQGGRHGLPGRPRHRHGHRGERRRAHSPHGRLARLHRQEPLQPARRDSALLAGVHGRIRVEERRARRSAGTVSPRLRRSVSSSSSPPRKGADASAA